MSVVLNYNMPFQSEFKINTQAVNRHKIQPVQILVPSLDGSRFRLNEEGLRSVLGDATLRDKKVAIISVAGAFRKGKSFLLNFFLEYLYALQKSQKNKTPLEWLENDTVVQGFHWRSGAKRDTVGIWMWGEPINIESRGKEIAVVLMDTQGTFDNQSTLQQCTTIFALSTMVSSLQIYNVVGDIQEDALQSLSLFVEFGRLAMQQQSAAPFQSLCFCVRDFKSPAEYPFGKEGGKRYLQDVLDMPPGQADELRAPRGQLSACFDHLYCFLLPHPGIRVAERTSFRGAVADIRSEFVDMVREMAESMLSPEALQAKTINGKAVTCERIMQCFKEYSETFESSPKLQPANILQANARLLAFDAIDNAKRVYCKEMDKVMKTRLSEKKLLKAHKICEKAAVEEYNKQPKIAVDKTEQDKNLEKLKELIQENFEQYMIKNATKQDGNRGSHLLLGVGLGVGASSAVAGTALAVAAGVSTAGVVAVPIAVAAATGAWGYHFTKPQLGRRFVRSKQPLLASFRRNSNPS